MKVDQSMRGSLKKINVRATVCVHGLMGKRMKDNELVIN